MNQEYPYVSDELLAHLQKVFNMSVLVLDKDMTLDGLRGIQVIMNYIEHMNKENKEVEYGVDLYEAQST